MCNLVKLHMSFNENIIIFHFSLKMYMSDYIVIIITAHIYLYYSLDIYSNSIQRFITHF
jgi:hypothetical protein